MEWKDGLVDWIDAGAVAIVELRSFGTKIELLKG